MCRPLDFIVIFFLGLMLGSLLYFLFKKGRKSKDNISLPVTDPGLAAFKEYLEGKLEEVKASLIMVDVIQHFFIYSDGKEIKEVSLTMADDMWNEEQKRMEELCNSPKVKYAALLFDSYMFTGDVKKIKEIQQKGTDLQDVGGTVDVIMLFLYTRDNIYNRNVKYEKRGFEDYWFADSGYQENVDPGKYSTPFPGKYSTPFSKLTK
jgi:hypothetical protein